MIETYENFIETILFKFSLKFSRRERQQSFYTVIQINPCTVLVGTAVKNWRILLEQIFTACRHHETVVSVQHLLCGRRLVMMMMSMTVWLLQRGITMNAAAA